MAGGQAIDLDSVGVRADLARTRGHASCEDRRAAARVGAARGRRGRAPDAREREALDRYAAAVGLAFQVVDDMLDVETDSATLGKTAGKDAANDKPTVVTALGIGPAKQLAARLRDDAHRALDELGGDVGRLRDLAAFVIDRAY